MSSKVLASWEKIPSSITADRSVIGGKAEGILALPREWVPEFVILTRHFYDDWLKRRDSFEVLTNLPASEQNIIATLLQSSISRIGPPQIIVRSNSPVEHSVNSRGNYLSEIVEPSLQEIAKAIDKILLQADPDPIYIILQGYIRGLQGHMSNERRVSPKPSLWRIEPSHPLPDLDDRLVASRIRPIKELLAESAESLKEALRTVAGRLTWMDQGQFHCEWVWDGHRLWIVQADQAHVIKENLFANRYIKSKDKKHTIFKPASPHLIHFTNVQPDTWKKLQRPMVFRKLGLPAGDVYLLTADKWNNDEVRHDPNFIDDLSRICQYPVVVRCDLASSQKGRTDILLPTSNPLTDVSLLTEFMDRVSKEEFKKKGIPLEDSAFLLASLVPARASAWIHTYPSGQKVTVDALWGFPDGLLFLPHDTFFYDVIKKTIHKVRRYKGLCLLVQNNKWVYSEVGTPHDWGPVLRDDEISTMAQWGLRLAKELDAEIQLMCLARIGSQRGPEACLPWHYTTTPLLQYERAIPHVLSFKDIVIISSEDELRQLSINVPINVKAFLIRPIEDLRRDENFIRRVARFAAEQNKPLLFEGSLLGHAYYIMTNEGAQVIPVTPDLTESTKITYGKLVRDKIPAVVEKAGGMPVFYTLTREEAKKLLARKLIEEAFEVWGADQDTLAEELADALEVIESLRENASISSESLNEIQERKRAKRGGFEKLIYLKETVTKPLKSLKVESRTLPQFEDDIPEKVVGAPDEEQQFLEFLENRAPNVIAEISVPLVPPTEKGKSIFSSNGEGVKVVCRYEDGILVLTVIKDSPNVGIATEQFEMFSETTFQTEETNQQLTLFSEESSAARHRKQKGRDR